MTSPATRVVLVGSVLADVAMTVGAPAARGGATRAESAVARAGGGYGVLLGARRLGLQAALAGRLGTGPMAALIGAALEREGIEVLLASREGEQGLSVSLVEPSGVTTWVASRGVEAHIGADDLAALDMRPDDLVYLSCSDLVEEQTGRAVTAWLARRPRRDGIGIVVAVGRFVADVADDVLDEALAAADVLVLDDTELELITGATAGVSRDRALAQVFEFARPGVLVVLRLTDGDCLLCRRGRPAQRYPVPGPRTDFDRGDEAHLVAELVRLGDAAVMGTPSSPSLSR